MTTPTHSSEDQNSYFIDHESGAEMARLLDQDGGKIMASAQLLRHADALLP